MERRFKLKINNKEKLEDLLQEIYDDSMRQMNQINNNMNELRESTKLSDDSVTIDSKVKYAKAMHDYTTDKEKAIARKMDVAKLMSEVIKFNGDIEKLITDSEIAGNIDDIFSNIRDSGDNNSTIINNSDQSEHYITNKPKKDRSLWKKNKNDEE